MTTSKIESIVRRCKHTAALAGDSPFSVACLLAVDAISALQVEVKHLTQELSLWQELAPSTAGTVQSLRATKKSNRKAA